eukprot:scaffold574_cov246-Pinguiococcus_pyrenoidosus.AAC.21
MESSGGSSAQLCAEVELHPPHAHPGPNLQPPPMGRQDEEQPLGSEALAASTALRVLEAMLHRRSLPSKASCCRGPARLGGALGSPEAEALAREAPDRSGLCQKDGGEESFQGSRLLRAPPESCSTESDAVCGGELRTDVELDSSDADLGPRLQPPPVEAQDERSLFGAEAPTA